MKKILEILNSHSSEKGVKEYKDTVEKVKAAMDVNLEKVTGADIADSISRIERATYQTFVDSKKDGDAEKYINWNDYIGEYNLALQEIEKYNNFYDGEYTTAFNNYESAAKAYSEKVKNLSQPKYKAVEDLAKALVEDFKSNYGFKGTYSEAEIKSMVQAALSEQNALKTSLGADYLAYEKAKNSYGIGYYDNEAGRFVEGTVSKLNYLKENADFRVDEATRKGENLIENSNGGNSGTDVIEYGSMTAEISNLPKTDFYLYDCFNIDNLIISMKTSSDYVVSYIYGDYPDSNLIYTIPDMSMEGEQEVEVKFVYGDVDYKVSYKITVSKEPENEWGYTARIIKLPRQTVFDVGEEFVIDDMLVGLFDETGKLRSSQRIFSQKFYCDYYGYSYEKDDRCDTSKPGVYNVKVGVAWDPYWITSKTLSTSVVYQVTVKELTEQNAYTITYSGKDTLFNNDLVKENIVHIKVSPSLNELDIMDLYAFKKSVLAENPAKLDIEEIPASITYKLNIPECSTMFSGSSWCSWKENNQKEIIIKFFKDLLAEEDPGITYDVEPSSFWNTFRNIVDLSYLTFRGNFHDSAYGGMFIYEVIPGINFVIAHSGVSGNHCSVWFSIQIEDGVTLDISGTIEINTDWSDSLNAENGYICHPDFKPIFWVKDNGCIKISDWSKIKITSNGMDGIYSDYRLLFYPNFYYAMKIIGFDPQALTSAEQLPVIKLSKLTPATVNFHQNKELDLLDEYEKDYRVRVSSRFLINTSFAGEIIKRYYELDALDKLSYCEDVSDSVSVDFAWDGNPSKNFPCLYIGNEKNPDRPKIGLGLAQWLLKNRIATIVNVCIVNDGTDFDPSVWYTYGEAEMYHYSFSDESLERYPNRYGTKFGNVIFEVDMSCAPGIGTCNNGVIDFSNDVPLFLDADHCFFMADLTIIRKITHKLIRMKGYQFGRLDVNLLSKRQISLIEGDRYQMINRVNLISSSEDIIFTEMFCDFSKYGGSFLKDKMEKKEYEKEWGEEFAWTSNFSYQNEEMKMWKYKEN